MKYNRIFLIVLDSLGIGGAHDAKDFNDEGANTLLHILEHTKQEYPALKKTGFLSLVTKKEENTNSYYARANEISNGKDTLTGHLEMMGIETRIPFRTFPNGFDKELIEKLEEETGRGVLGNCVASGTEIIKELGEEHMKTGKIIVYTSADSVLQIAAHEEVVPLEELYKICEIARKITLEEKWKVGRIIARPFKGEVGNFVRTSNRHDYALDPAGKTVLDSLKEKNYKVISIGKIADIFNGCGIVESYKTKDNLDGILKIIEMEKQDFTGLCFANLNDFDSKYGHRRDIIGYGNAILEFDQHLEEIMDQLKDDDLLIITADHGNDPSFPGTDHTREQVGVVFYAKGLKEPKQLKDFSTFATIGSTIADNFQVEMPSIGESILKDLQ